MAATAARRTTAASADHSLEWPAICIPAAATNLDGFRSWAQSEDFPQRGSVSFINGEILIDMSPEELETHIKVKSEIASVLHRLCRDLDLGNFYPDGALLTNAKANLSTEPDGTFLSWKCIQAQRIRRVPRKGHPGEFVELEGTPDMVLEITSRSSVIKDTQTLRQSYHRAGIPEYWLVNALGKQLVFQILVRRSTGYVAARNRRGWQDSPAFGHEFRLRRGHDQLGDRQYFLDFRPGSGR